MPAHEVAILADDLTGALDAAAPFASEARPVVVVWGERAPPAAAGFALDSETRELPLRRAEAIVDRLLPYLADGRIALKKVDSLLRGNTLGELAACWKGGIFRSLVFAPAFPAQDRVTRNGTQFARIAGEWRRVAEDLAAGLRRYGLASRRLARSEPPAGDGLFVCDAESDADLASIAGGIGHLAEPVLWCGSAGLARALAGEGSGGIELGGERRLAVVDTRHPVTGGQTAALEAAFPESIIAVATIADAAGASDRVAGLLDRHGAAALVFRLPPLAPAEAAAIASRTFQALRAVAAPDLLVATGGETLVRLCGALAATRLDAIGEWRPGVPVARMADGAWSGTTLVSKSGAFGTPDVLTALFTCGTATH